MDYNVLWKMNSTARKSTGGCKIICREIVSLNEGAAGFWPAEAAADTCFLYAGAIKGNVGIVLHFGVKVRKVTCSESAPLIRHRLHKGQGLGGGRADVVYATLLETTERRTLVGVHEPSVASATDDITEIITLVSTPCESLHILSHKDALLVERQL